jgi:hypothetical protein
VMKIKCWSFSCCQKLFKVAWNGSFRVFTVHDFFCGNDITKQEDLERPLRQNICGQSQAENKASGVFI